MCSSDLIDPELKTFLLKESDACLKSADVQMNKIMGSIKSGTPPVEISLLSFRLKQGEEPLGSVHFLTEQANPVVPRTLTDFLLNISAQISAQLQIQSLSSGLRLDPLTRLYNRGYLKDRLREELVRSTRTRAALSLLLLDIDHFKSLNEKYGRQTGDEVLRSLAG